MKEGPHTQSQQRRGSARECQDNVPSTQASTPQLPPQAAGATCCQPTARQAEKEPKTQQFLYRQSWHVPQTASPLTMPLRPWWGACDACPPTPMLLEELWAASRHKGALQFTTDIQSCWNLRWSSGIAQSIASYIVLHPPLLLPTLHLPPVKRFSCIH